MSVYDDWVLIVYWVVCRGVMGGGKKPWGGARGGLGVLSYLEEGALGWADRRHQSLLCCVFSLSGSPGA